MVVRLGRNRSIGIAPHRSQIARVRGSGGVQRGQPGGQDVEALAAVPTGFDDACADRGERRRRAVVCVIGDERVGQRRGGDAARRRRPPRSARGRWSRIRRRPPSCSMTAGPLSPMRACGVTITRVHKPAAMLIPPNDPTVPATTPMTGASGRRSSTAEQISATALSPRLASCSRTPPVSNRITAAVGVPARESAAASSSAWRDLCSRHLAGAAALEALLDRGDHHRVPVDGAACDDGSVIGLRGDALGIEPRGFQPVERTGEHPQRARIQQRRGAAERVEFDEAACAAAVVARSGRPAVRCSRCRIIRAAVSVVGGGFGGLAQSQSDDARCGAEVVEFPSTRQRGAAEEPLAGRHARRCRIR